MQNKKHVKLQLRWWRARTHSMYRLTTRRLGEASPARMTAAVGGTWVDSKAFGVDDARDVLAAALAVLHAHLDGLHAAALHHLHRALPAPAPARQTPQTPASSYGIWRDISSELCCTTDT